MRRLHMLVTGALLATAVTAAAGTTPTTPASAQTQGEVGSETGWIVSLGDSAISGEGGRWAGNTNGPSSAVDALGPTAYHDGGEPGNSFEQIVGCHRSRSAAVHIDQTIPPTEGGIKSVNFACSGAQTTTPAWQPGNDYKPGIDFAPTPPGLPSTHKGQALLLEEFARSHDVEAVVLMIGANNLGYGSILERCVIGFMTSFAWFPDLCSEDPSITSRLNAENWAKLRDDIGVAIDNVYLAMENAGHAESDFTLFVLTYWGVMPDGDGFRYPEWPGWDRQLIGGCGVYDADADWGEHEARPKLNEAVRAAIPTARSNIELVEMEDLTAGRQLCADTVDHLEDTSFEHGQSPGAADAVEWVTMVRLGPCLAAEVPPEHEWLLKLFDFGPSEYQCNEGGHANYWGQLAMRNCLRQAYNAGDPRSVRCRAAGGLNAHGEPNVSIS